MAILPVLIQDPMGEEMINVFLENGSNTTLIDSALVTRLGLNGSSHRLCVTTFNGTVEIPSRCVSFEVEPRRGNPGKQGLISGQHYGL